MSRPQEINDYITQNAPNSFCDKCIKEVLSLTKDQHAQQITATLATTRDFTRERTHCKRCANIKKSIRKH